MTASDNTAGDDRSDNVVQHPASAGAAGAASRPAVWLSRKPLKRKLMAILAADVVHYSRLVAEDEEGTLGAFRKHRREIAGIFDGYQGRVFNTAGDSVMASFDSAIDALAAAVSIQEYLKEANIPVPEERRLLMRIGVHIGDVVVDRTELVDGDAVGLHDRRGLVHQPLGV